MSAIAVVQLLLLMSEQHCYPVGGVCLEFNPRTAVSSVEAHREAVGAEDYFWDSLRKSFPIELCHPGNGNAIFKAHAMASATDSTCLSELEEPARLLLLAGRAFSGFRTADH